MILTAIEKVLAKAEEDVERSVRDQRILRCDLPTAVLHLVTTFEDGLRLTEPTLHALSSERYALNHAIKWAALYCHPAQTDMFGLRITAELYGDAGECLRYAASYDSVEACYREFYKNRLTATARGRSIRFRGPVGGRSDRDVIGNLLTEAAEIQDFIKAFEPPTQDLPALAWQTTQVLDSETIEYAADPRVLDHFRRLGASDSFATMPPETSIGSYSLDEARTVWTSLKALSATHALYCFSAGRHGVTAGAVNSAGLRMTQQELVRRLANLGNLHEGKVARIIDDLTLDLSGKIDIRTTPLIVVNECYLVIPQLLMGLRWEASILRNWARRYSGPYGAQVASQKVALGAILASSLASPDIKTSHTRKLVDPTGREIGDVDTAAYDTRTGTLLLTELKWLIPVEDIPEVITADKELLDGVNQAKTAHDFVEANPLGAMKALFPGERLPVPKRIQSVVFARGSIGSEHLAGTVIEIYPFELADRLARDLTGRTLDDFILSLPSTISPNPSSDWSYVERRVELAGWTFAVPSISYGQPSDAVEVGRNDPCPCGSGKKYKRCHGS